MKAYRQTVKQFISGFLMSKNNLSIDLSFFQCQQSPLLIAIDLPIAFAYWGCKLLLPIVVACHCECQFFTCEDGSMWTGAWKGECGVVSMEHVDGRM